MEIENVRAFSLVELLVVMTLLSLIVLALMAVFNSTQQAFRASVTQTDVLEGSRATMDLITTDLRGLTPSDGASNLFTGAVNFYATDNNYDIDYFAVPSISYRPLQQALPGSSSQRTNVLNWVFILGRENINGRDSWTGVGYVVNVTNSSPLYPLYRFYAIANVSVPPRVLYNMFWTNVVYGQWTNASMSHVMDGVVHFVVRPYDAAGYLMTNNAYWISAGQTNLHQNVHFYPSYWGEVGTSFFSNAVPASVELQLGVLEDRALARASSMPFQSVAQSNYLAQQSGKIHLFRQRVTIPNVDPSAYQ